MQKSKVWLATGLIDERVRNSAGDNLGKIEDIVVDPLTGVIQYAVLSFGGFLGVGDKLFAIPWAALSISPSQDYVLLDVDKETLERAPGFDRRHWPDMSDAAWQSDIHRYYGITRVDSPPRADFPRTKPAPAPRTVYVERPVPARKGMGVVTAALLVCGLLGLLWLTYMVTTRGWDSARQELSNSVQGAAYAMKETSEDATLTAKVKTAFSLSKRIPASQINVDSQEDVVTLRGEVPNEAVRTLAESIARDVPGVREVHNHIYAQTQSQ